MKKSVKKNIEPVEVRTWENVRPGLAFAGGCTFMYGLMVSNNPFLAGLGMIMAIVGAVRIEITGSDLVE